MSQILFTIEFMLKQCWLGSGGVQLPEGPWLPELMGMVQGRGVVLLVESLTARVALQCRQGSPLTLFEFALLQKLWI